MSRPALLIPEFVVRVGASLLTGTNHEFACRRETMNERSDGITSVDCALAGTAPMKAPRNAKDKMANSAARCPSVPNR
ncbi:hypothetical protein GCM10017774_65750 [Lentzea cavernae]|uniref:Uncharacterized protein n=1 Tax=Lentzea cavernae TaxID=2020703 RepID=A0ABQ3MMV8_9PSEU|nr:hypothetical protein GCM10017774_65750 [Lentzea cavernae]